MENYILYWAIGRFSLSARVSNTLNKIIVNKRMRLIIIKHMLFSFYKFL